MLTVDSIHYVTRKNVMTGRYRSAKLNVGQIPLILTVIYALTYLYLWLAILLSCQVDIDRLPEQPRYFDELATCFCLLLRGTCLYKHSYEFKMKPGSQPTTLLVPLDQSP